ncbi:MAG TPA: pitrilysin family protein [Terriglobales bacterium]|nr:pitrilysin family protein [Terriglobales bacterium]
MKKTVFSILTTVLFCASALAQQPSAPPTDMAAQTSGKVKRLNRAPVSNEVLKVKLPSAKEVVLPNGLTVLVLEQHRLPTVSYSLWIKSGAVSDPKDMPGLASFTADMLREGTTTRKSSQIAMELDEMGAALNANAEFGRDLTSISASSLSDSADKTMELMADVTLNATFPADELERYRRRELLGLTQIRTNPGFLARERFARAIYGDSPLATQSATVESLKGVTPEAMKAFREKYYAPNNAILGITGDITLAQAQALAKKHFGAWKKADLPKSAMPDITARNAAKVYLVDRPGSVQSNILAGGVSLKRSDPDYIPLTIANRILGGGSSARLFQNLREDKGYTYGAYSRVSSDIYPGTFVANTEVRNAVTDGSLHEMMFEMKRLRDETVPAQELEEAKRAIVASFALSLESPADLLNRSLTVKYYGLPADYWDRYPEQVARVNAATVQNIAKKYIDLPHMQIVVVGDAKQVSEAVSKYGTVENFDADGKAIANKP